MTHDHMTRLVKLLCEELTDLILVYNYFYLPQSQTQLKLSIYARNPNVWKQVPRHQGLSWPLTDPFEILADTVHNNCQTKTDTWISYMQ